MRRGGPPRIPQAHELASGHIFFCVTKAIKSLQAIEKLTDDGFGEDGLILVRSIFESYLSSVYLLARPAQAEVLVLARVGLEAGTHEYATKKSGVTDYYRIRELRTGRMLAHYLPGNGRSQPLQAG
jgi:hypothetical protein